MMIAMVAGLVIAVTACATPAEVGGFSEPPATAATAWTTTSTPSTSSTSTTLPPATTTTTAPHREVTIRGTGRVYTLEESQSFGEFGPLLWNLVTTIHHKDAIEHHPRHEWVIWGPLWGGHIYDPTRSHHVYGITDLDAIAPDEVASAVPAGTTIILREVRWSLDDLNAWSAELGEMVSNQVGQSICAISTRPEFGFTLEVAESRLDYVESLVDSLIERTSVPREAVILEVNEDCPRIRYLPP